MWSLGCLLEGLLVADGEQLQRGAATVVRV